MFVNANFFEHRELVNHPIDIFNLAGRLGKLGLANALIVDGRELETNFALAARNMIGVDVLPITGINVYDIMRRDTLVLTKAAVEALTERFK